MYWPANPSLQWSPPVTRGNSMFTQGAGLNYLLPQWSPLLIGGNTWEVAHYAPMPDPPQWSPPLNSGHGMRKVMTGVTDDVPQ